MKKIILKESELVHLLETAMDLDIYVQPVDYSTDNGNSDVEDSIMEILDRLKELFNMIQQGKRIDTIVKQKNS